MALSTSTMRPSLGNVAAFAPLRPAVRRARLVAPARAEKSLGDKIQEKTDEFVQATKENSGLDMDKLGEQAGNRSPQALGEVETPKGDVSDIMSFSGLLPELINSRAAMFGMLAALGAELGTRQPVFVQIQTAPLAILGAFVTIIVASIIPALRGADMEQKGAGPFTKEAEVLNGRIAMVAFALLIAVETWKAGPGLVP